MKQIIPFLWFDGRAEEAMNFYTSVFKNAKVGKVTRYGEAGPGPAGTVVTASFEIGGIEFVALNGGPQYTFSEAISFQIPCESQEEVDYFWDKLGEGGTIQQCGWLKDKFGVSWQVVPTALPQLLDGSDPVRSNRTVQAMLQMKKLDIAALEKAYQG